ncbi:MAG: ribonuclease HIII [Verrucomicrobia bacterium]|nr:ribonuclease HIII [Verrucomicrobiota bacterium]
MAPLTSYTIKLTDAQAAQVKAYLDSHGFQPQTVPYARFAGKGRDVGVVFYESGKLVAQGKGTEEFVQFFLEPQVLQEARLGYDEVLNPRAFEPHIGVDESGKGDYFGPMVVSAVFASKGAFAKLKELNVRDSKTITSDNKAIEMAGSIRRLRECAAEVVSIGPEAYNRLHDKMRNVNDILGWGHARAIENVLARIDPQKTGTICARAIADQFGNKRIIERSLMDRGKRVQLEQRHRAEEDLAVAAASIVARAEFVLGLRRMSKKWGIVCPKGASDMVIEAGREFVVKHGREALGKVAKLHFRTTEKVEAPA